MSQNEALVLNSNLTELFDPILKDVLQSQSVNISNHSYVYLLNLLESYALIGLKEEADAHQDKMLSERLLLALQIDERHRQEKSLKSLGENALFRVGFFSSSLKRKIAGIKFHIDIGRTAYSHLFNATRKPAYEEFSERFHDYADILSGVRERVNMTSDKSADILTLSDWFSETGSKEAEKKLIENGVSIGQIKKASNQ